VRNGAEDHAVRRFGGLERRLRERGALRVQRGHADRHRRERKAELERAVDGAQNRHRRGRDLRPDAVAPHHGDAHRGGLRCRIGRHRSLIGVSLATP